MQENITSPVEMQVPVLFTGETGAHASCAASCPGAFPDVTGTPTFSLTQQPRFAKVGPLLHQVLSRGMLIH